MQVVPSTLVPDNTGCEHKVIVGPKRRGENLDYGHCTNCKREVALELDKNGSHTGRSWLIEYGPESR
ncbi:MAG TPA: hypothetical protein VFC29_01390 [Candidatus Limnocylindrales bacterium]|nr:hypothetical protein [Candidatus Limnocylindrales bacterium]